MGEQRGHTHEERRKFKTQRIKNQHDLDKA